MLIANKLVTAVGGICSLVAASGLVYLDNMLTAAVQASHAARSTFA